MPIDDPTPERPMGGLTVLVTRARGDNSATRSRLEAMGANVIEMPTIAVLPAEDAVPLDDALRNLGTYDWIVFASRNAVRAVYDRLEMLGLTPATHARIASIGPSTGAELMRRGASVACSPPAATAASLVRSLAGMGLAGARVLLPSGDLARPELSDGLRAAGAIVDCVPAYRTVQPLEERRESLEAFRRGAIDIVALASPSAAVNLVAMLGADARYLQYLQLACIGPTTAAAVRELGFEPAAIAERHTIDGLIDAIAGLRRRGGSR